MNITPMPGVECALLHAEFAPMPSRSIFAEAAAIARRLGIGDEAHPMVTSSETDAHMFFGNLRVMVSQNPQPLGPAGFEGAFAMTSTQLRFPDARAVVAAHRANSFVTIGKGPIDPNQIKPEQAEFLLRTLGEAAFFTTSQEVELGMKFCRELSAFIHANHAATAMHWCMNDYLLRPKELLSLISGPPEFAAVNPVLTSGTGRFTQDTPLGVIGRSSQYLIGRLVVIEEARVPAPYLIERLLQFVAICQMRGSIIPDGDTFGIDETEVIKVKWQGPSERFSLDHVVLTITRSEAHGIDGSPPPQLRIRYDDEAKVAGIDADDLPLEIRDEPRFAAALSEQRARLAVPHARLDLAELRAIAVTPPAPEPRSFFASLLDGILRR